MLRLNAFTKVKKAIDDEIKELPKRVAQQEEERHCQN